MDTIVAAILVLSPLVSLLYMLYRLRQRRHEGLDVPRSAKLLVASQLVAIALFISVYALGWSDEELLIFTLPVMGLLVMYSLLSAVLVNLAMPN